jgi:hypothetical protein
MCSDCIALQSESSRQRYCDMNTWVTRLEGWNTDFSARMRTSTHTHTKKSCHVASFVSGLFEIPSAAEPGSHVQKMITTGTIMEFGNEFARKHTENTADIGDRLNLLKTSV